MPIRRCCIVSKGDLLLFAIRSAQQTVPILGITARLPHYTTCISETCRSDKAIKIYTEFKYNRKFTQTLHGNALHLTQIYSSFHREVNLHISFRITWNANYIGFRQRRSARYYVTRTQRLLLLVACIVLEANTTDFKRSRFTLKVTYRQEKEKKRKRKKPDLAFKRAEDAPPRRLQRPRSGSMLILALSGRLIPVLRRLQIARIMR